MSKAKGYPVPAESFHDELEIKKSRFIAQAHGIENREQALALIQQAHHDYPDARHVCWAYLLGNPASASNAAMNDDGEPSGTAGKPILNVLQHKGVGDVLIIVIRYFGGIKLGAGGLVRAYGGAAELVMSQLAVIESREQTAFQLRMDFALEQRVRHWLSTHSADIDDVAYSEAVTMQCRVESDKVDALRAFCEAHAVAYKLDA